MGRRHGQNSQCGQQGETSHKIDLSQTARRAGTQRRGLTRNSGANTGKKDQATGGARGEQEGAARRGGTAQSSPASESVLGRRGRVEAGASATQAKVGWQAGAASVDLCPGTRAARTEGGGRQQAIGRGMPGIVHGIAPAEAGSGAATKRDAWRHCHTKAEAGTAAPKATSSASRQAKKEEGRRTHVMAN